MTALAMSDKPNREALVREYMALSDQWSPYRRASDRDSARMKELRELIRQIDKKERK